MNNGIELLRLYQRKTPDGDTCFFGTLGDGLVSMVRDQRKRDVWIVSVHSPSQDTNNCNRSPARAIAPPADEGDCDDGDSDEGNSDEGGATSLSDELPADLMASPSQQEGR